MHCAPAPAAMRAGGSRIASVLARTSAYPRTETHLAQQRLSGAGLSVGAVLLAALLLFSELRDFLRTEHATKVRRLVPPLAAPFWPTNGCFWHSSVWTRSAARRSFWSCSTLHFPRCLVAVRPRAPPLPAVRHAEGNHVLQSSSWMRLTSPAPTSGMRARASHGCVDCGARRAHIALMLTSQSRLDARGKDIGPFVLAAGQPDFAAFFGAANAQACALSTVARMRPELTDVRSSSSCFG